MAQPRVDVTAPPQVPLGYGLLSVASEQLRADPRARNGVQYEPTSGTTGGGVIAIDQATARPAEAFEPDSYEEGDRYPAGYPLVETDPFLIYEAIKAKPVGITGEVLLARAKARLQLTAGFWIERGFHPQLVAAAEVHPETATAVDPDIAIGLLEEWLSLTIGAQGVIHVPRRGIGALAKHVKPTGARQQTHLGCPVAFGGGYANTSPDGTPAAPGVVWVYGSGPVQVNRSGTDELSGDARSSMNYPSNTSTVVASEVISAGYETGAVAVPVKFELENP